MKAPTGAQTRTPTKAQTKGKWLGAVMVAVLLCASSASAAQDSRDLGIALEISQQIDRYPRYTIFDFVHRNR